MSSAPHRRVVAAAVPFHELLDGPKQATPPAPRFPALRAFILARTAAGSR